MADLKDEQRDKEKYVQSNIDDYISQEKGDTLSLQNQEDASKENFELEKSQDDSVSLQKKKLDEVEQSVSKHKGKRNKILNILFFILNICVVLGILFYQLMKEDLKPFGEISFNIGSFFIVILLLSCVLFVESFQVSYLLKQSTGKWRLGMAYKVAQLGRYYDSVTPMASGGQTFQIAYLKSHGTPIHTALSIPLAKYVFGQFAWVITSLACLIISWTHPNSYGTFVSIASILGFVLSFVVLAVVTFLSICKTVGKKLVVRSLKILQKLKIVKNYDKQYEKITKYISDFQDVMKQYASSPKDFLIMMFLALAKNIFNYSMPFFIIKFFMPSIEGSMFIRLFVMSCLVDLASSFFPLPGGTLMNEISFTSAFEKVVEKSSLLPWVLISWRTLSYYFYLLQGVCILSYDFAIGNKKYKWEVKRENLVEESEVFKQEQINKFRAERAKRRKRKNKTGAREYL